jgi:hypothetical protein
MATQRRRQRRAKDAERGTNEGNPGDGKGPSGQLVDILGTAYLLERDQASGRGQARPKSR